MDKEDVPCIHNGVLLKHKKELNKVICSNIDGLGDYHTKSERHKPYDHLYAESKKMIQMNLFRKQRQTHRI